MRIYHKLTNMKNELICLIKLILLIIKNGCIMKKIAVLLTENDPE